MDVVLLADNTGIPQGLPAVGWGQPEWGGEEAAGVRAPNPASRHPTTTQMASGVRKGHIWNLWLLLPIYPTKKEAS